jgi:hypothetical protein
MLRRLVVVGVTAAVVRAAPAPMAAPEIVLVYGSAAAERWAIADWGENHWILASLRHGVPTRLP